MSVSDKIEPALAAVRVCRIARSSGAVQADVLAVEEPLEIRFNVYTEAERICLGPAATCLSIDPETRPWLSVV
jgi:hypothetical protein